MADAGWLGWEKISNKKGMAPHIHLRDKPLMMLSGLGGKKYQRGIGGIGCQKISAINAGHREALAYLPDFLPYLILNILVAQISDYPHN